MLRGVPYPEYWESHSDKIRIPYTDIEKMAGDLFPYWHIGQAHYGWRTFESLLKDRDAEVKESRTGSLPVGWQLFDAAFMVCCLTHKIRKEDDQARIAWERRCDDFWRPNGGSGWRKL